LIFSIKCYKMLILKEFKSLNLNYIKMREDIKSNSK